MTNPIQKYEARVQKVNSLLCVGLDPDMAKLPEKYLSEESPQFAFNKDIIDQTHEFAAAYKPQSAFYEADGIRGIESLKKTCEYLQQNHPDIFTILDAKRGDIGNTNLGYTAFIFDFLGIDAFTVHPYLGSEAMSEIINRKDGAYIILVRTSNPGAGEFQDLIVEGTGKKFWEVIAESVAGKWNANGNMMMVIGATYPEEMKRAREIAGDMTFLVPGVGAQGGDVKAAVEAGLNSKKMGMIINSSRGIIFAENPAEEAKKLRDEINLYR